MYQEGEQPGDGIGDIEAGKSSHRGKHRMYPDNPQGAGADEGHKRRKPGSSQPPLATAADFHKAAEELEYTDAPHPQVSRGHDLRQLSVIGGDVQPKEGILEQIQNGTQGSAYQGGHAQALPEHPANPAVLSRPQVLADEGERRLIKSVESGVNRAC